MSTSGRACDAPECVQLHLPASADAKCFRDDHTHFGEGAAAQVAGGIAKAPRDQKVGLALVEAAVGAQTVSTKIARQNRKLCRTNAVEFQMVEAPSSL